LSVHRRLHDGTIGSIKAFFAKSTERPFSDTSSLPATAGASRNIAERTAGIRQLFEARAFVRDARDAHAASAQPLRDQIDDRLLAFEHTALANQRLEERNPRLHGLLDERHDRIVDATQQIAPPFEAP
jgi:hypothetical protein